MIFKQSFVVGICSCNWTSSETQHEIVFFQWWEIVYCGCPKNLQHDLVYAPVATKQRDISASRLLHTSHFKQVHQVSIVVLKLGYTNVIFIEYYREVLPMQWSAGLLETCLSPTHLAPGTVEFLCHETDTPFIKPDMWLASSPYLNPVCVCQWLMQQHAYQVSVQDVDELHQGFVETQAECWMIWLIGDRNDWKGVSTLMITHLLCGFACLKFKILYNITNDCFQSCPLFGENCITSIKWTSPAFHNVVWWHFLVWWTNALVSNFLRIPCTKNDLYLFFWLSYLKNSRVTFTGQCMCDWMSGDMHLLMCSKCAGLFHGVPFKNKVALLLR